MKTLLLLLRTKLFLFAFLSSCTFILANNYVQRNDFFKFTEVKEDIVAKPENDAVQTKKAAHKKMNLQLQENSFRDASDNFEATVTSDYPDYAPLSTAIFTGAGFAPFESVVLKVKNLFQPCHTVSADSSYLPWTVTADENGAFVTPWTVCNCPGDSLRLRAVGQISHDTAYLYFSDGSNDKYSPTISPTAVCTGTSNQAFTFRITNTGGGSSVIKSMIINIPSGVTVTTPTAIVATAFTSANVSKGVWTNGSAGTQLKFSSPGSGTDLTSAAAGDYLQFSFTVPTTLTTNITWTTSGFSNNTYSAASNGAAVNNGTDPIVTVTPTVGTPTAITVGSGVEPACQLTNGTTTTTYSTTATNSTGFNWSISNPSAGSINSSGVMTWANGFSGSVNIQVTANGCNGPSSQVVRSVTVTPTVGIPTAITVGSGVEPACQLTNGTTTTTYSTTATNSTGFNWSISNPSAGSINSSGVMTWANGFSGSVNIQVTANGCNGPSSQVVRSVSITPTVGTPTAITIGSGVEPACQLTNGATTTTYSTTANNSTGFNWSISNPSAGSINSSGVMTWANGFSGSVDIQVTANGCNGPSSQVVRSVTVTPTVGTPTAITIGSGVEPACQLTNGTTTTTYSTTATNSTGFNWSISNPSAGSINSSGVMTWANGFSGSVDIQVTANGCNGPSSQVLRSVVINLPPSIFNVSFTGSLCGTAVITLDGTETGVNYTLFRNASSVQTVAGTGSGISFSGVTQSGTYTVVATNATTGCSSTMNGSVDMGGGSPPSSTFTVTGGGIYCSGGSGVPVGLSGSETGVTYQLFLGASPVGSSVSGTGSAISFGSQTGTGIYTVVGTKTSGGCTATMTGSVQVSIDTTPPTLTSGGAGLTLGCNPSAGDINAALGTATATDAVTTPTVTSSDGSVSSNGCLRSQTRTFTAKDACNNTSTVSRTATWTEDVTKPVFTGNYNAIDLDCNPTAAQIQTALGSASATDACSTPTLSVSDGAVQNDGCQRSQTRSWSAIDGCGNIETISRTVSWIVDVTKPVFTGSYSAIDLDCNPTASQIETALGSASATDGCSEPSINSSDNTETVDGCNHSQTRTFTATDHCGNAQTISRTVSWIVDITKPVFTGSYSAIDLDCNPTAAQIETALGSASATDGCSEPSISASDNIESVDGCSHSQTRTFTATDHCGNAQTISRTVSWLVDVTKPVFTGNYSAIDLDCNPTAAAIEAALGSASATDGCSTPSLSASDNTETVDGCNHSQTRTFTATDHCGNAQTVSRTVSWIVDVTKPVFTGSYSAIDLDCNPTAAAIEAALGSASATDGCNEPSINSSDNTETADGCNHSQTRTFTATDHCGNTETVSRTVSWIVDVTKPVFSGSYTAIDLDCNPTAAQIETALGSASATDGCSEPSISASDNTETVDGCSHSQTRTFTATDHCGNAQTVSRTVSWIVDLTKPVFTGTYTAIDLDCNPTAAQIETALGSASATDGCSEPSINSSDNIESVDGCNHSQTRTFTATDHCGNTQTVSRTVSWIVDITKPVFTGTYSAVDLDCNPTAAEIQTALGSASATDGCSEPSISSSDNTETVDGCNHSQTRTFTATDHCGNAQTISRTVSWIVDVTKPIFTGSYGAIDLDCNPTAAQIETALGSASATDGCSEPSISSSDNTETVDGCNHSQTRTFTATDHCGNAQIISRTVSWIVDLTKPVFTGSYSAIDLDCNPTAAAIEAALGSATATDGCSEPSLSSSDNTETVDGCNHSQTRTFTATDHCGNAQTISRTVSWIVDITKPVFTGSYTAVDLDCNPTAAQIETALGSASATDGCSEPSLSSSDNTESVDGCNHSQTRTFTATDHCGNTQTVSRTVSWIVDVTKPVFTGSYTAVDLDCNPTAAQIETALGSASATDGCSEPSISSSDNTASVDGCNHSQTRTFTATDHCGNTQTVSRTVSWIVDITKPVFTGSYTAVDLDCNPTAAAIEAALGSASATDGCSEPSISASDNTETVDGCNHSQTRTFTATDHCGNAQTISRTVSWIVDITKPVFTGSYSAIDLDCNPTAAQIETALGSASATDGCSEPSISASDNTETVDGCNHSQTRTFTATDHCGNAQTISRTVSWIVDVTKPVFTGTYSAIDLDCNPTAAQIETALGSASATDGCSEPSISSSDNTETVDGCNHSKTRSFTATDHCGNAQTISRTVSWIVDITKPVFTGTYNAVDLDCNPTAAEIQTALGSASATDGCSEPSINSSDNTETVDGCNHSQTRTFTATDHCGNAQTVSRTVSWIVDVTKPVFSGSYSAIDLDCNPTAAEIQTALGSASATDGCSEPSISSSDNTESVNGCVHSQTRTFTATDHCGNVQTISRTVSWIVDITKPVFTGSYSAVDLDCNPTAAEIQTALGSASATDGCSEPSISSLDNNESVNGCVHSQTRTFTATDHCGNAQTISRTVSWIVDITKPVFTGTYSAIDLDCNPTAAQIETALGGASATDGCSEPSISASDNTEAVDGCNHSKTRTFTATDHCGNAQTISRTVSWIVDITKPVFTGSYSAVDLDCNPTAAEIQTALGSASATDGCSEPSINSSDNTESVNGCVHSQTRTFTATDHCGNAQTISRTVSWIVDVTKPVFTGTYTAIDLDCNPTASQIETALGSASATDGCSEPSINSSDNTENVNGCVHSKTRTFLATDHCGNTQTVSRTVSWIVDVTPPVISGVGAPATISCPSTASFSSPTASDACSTASLSYTDATTPGTCVSAYSKTRTWLATDHCGNTSTASQTITVVDNTAPSISCTSNKSVNPNNGTPACTYKHTGTAWNATASDLCSSVTVIYNLTGATTTSNLTTLDNAVFNLGLTTVTAIATDACGNSAQCSFTVTVTSTLSATITSNKTNVYYGAPGDQTATITATATGGTGPYKIKITMQNGANPAVSPAAQRVSGKLICDFVNNAGDEAWTPGANTNSGLSTGIICSTNTVTASSTSNAISGAYSINVSLLADARFIATVTDANGCTYTTPYDIAAKVDAEDVRCFAGNSGIPKVTICHRTGSATNPCVTICVDNSAVAEHLAHGDFMGKCTPNCVAPVNNAGLGLVTADASHEIIPTETFNIKAYPNPSENQFTILVEGGGTEKVQVAVFDAVGRLVKKIEKTDNSSQIRFGEDLKVGAYFVEVRQGSNRKTIKLVKQ